MPDNFEIVRHMERYHDAGIRCDYCLLPLPSTYHYTISRNGRRVSTYPFHTVRCAERCIDSRYGYNGSITITRCSDELDDTQEEATED